ncbi:MAG: antirestriction protein ArdA [Oscillospiraceae bacterium]|nr:antirestriction protein ArdA [Oscillospiraceae bacterium]
MALEIAIDELGIGNDKVAFVKLPANKNEVIDALDRVKIYGKTFFRIEECDEVPELAGYEFSEEPMLDELNFLAKRLEEIANDKEILAQTIAYRALLQRGFGTINEAINCTYNLETIPVYPCKDLREYGEIVLDNDMLEELEDVPYELYDLLDPDKVGRAMMEREGGKFIDGYYAVPSSYEPALVYDEELPERMEEWIFRLEITGNFTENKDDYEVLTLPADEENMQRAAEKFGEKYIVECVCVGFKSAISQISDVCFNSMDDIYAANAVARRYSELSREDAAKFKTVLEHELWRGWDKVNAIINALDSYEFDSSIKCSSEFGTKYLSKMLPPDFDRSLIDGALNDNFGSKILRANECVITGYGAVSHCGGHLYEIIEAPEQEQTSDFIMGGIS